MNYGTKIVTSENSWIAVNPSLDDERIAFRAGREPIVIGMHLTPTEAKDLAKALLKATKGVKS